MSLTWAHCLPFLASIQAYICLWFCVYTHGCVCPHISTLGSLCVYACPDGPAPRLLCDVGALSVKNGDFPEFGEGVILALLPSSL